MTPKYNLYLGKAGQMAVMSHFLIRGWNVATPEVDVGDDLFVVEDKKGIFFRMQVKTTQATFKPSGGYSVRFNLPLSQLQQSIEPELFYTLVITHNYQFLSLIVIRRSRLLELYQNHEIGSVVGDSLMLYMVYKDQKLTCSKVDFTPFLNNFDDFGVIQH
jgi:hypothetical protein